MKYDRIVGYKPGRKEYGSARILAGRIHVSVFFVSTAAMKWSADEMKWPKHNLLEAERWLVSKAAQYGKVISFHNTYYGDENDDSITVDSILKYSESTTEEKEQEKKKILAMRGINNFYSYKRHIKDTYECSQGISVFIHAVSGRSYAMPAWSNRDFDTAVCHKWDTVGAYVHEILHLFGAWDMYKREFDKGNAREEKCGWYFSDSIMRQAYYMWNQKIDEITAWLVGLKEEEKPWYSLFEPGLMGREEEISKLYLYHDWRTGEYSDKPVPPKPEPPRRVITKKKARPLDSWTDFKDWVHELKYLPKWKKHILNFFGMTIAGMILIAVFCIWGMPYNWKFALAFSAFLSLNFSISLIADDI